MIGQIIQYTDSGMLFLAIAAIFLVLSLLSLLLFIIKLLQIFTKKEPEIIVELEHGEDDIAFVVKGNMIEFQGKKLKYFTLKDKPTDPDKLKLGQKVKVIKKSKTEAYVKAVK